MKIIRFELSSNWSSETSFCANSAQDVNSKKLDHFYTFSKLALITKRPSHLKFTPFAKIVKLSLVDEGLTNLMLFHYKCYHTTVVPPIPAGRYDSLTILTLHTLTNSQYVSLKIHRHVSHRHTHWLSRTPAISHTDQIDGMSVRRPICEAPQ